MTTVIDQAGEALGGFLPRLGGALVLLVGGFLVALLLGRLLRKALERAHLDEALDRFGVGDLLARVGLDRSMSRLLGAVLRIALTLVVIFAALSLLGLQFLSQALNEAVLFVPQVLTAAALLLAGVVLGGLVRDRVDRTTRQMDFAVPLGAVAQVAVVAVFAITAAAQVAVSTLALMIVVGIVLAAVAATLAIAFGLGGREVARELSAGRYLRTAYSEGQEISVDGVRGEIVALETAATVLRTPAGDTVRLPNALLLTSVVTLHSGDR